jgi:hypothetical protein
VKHEPCRALANAEVFAKLITGHTVFAVGNHPNGGHPFVEAQRGVLKNAPNLDRELLLAVVAKPDFAGLDERVLRSIAAWTKHFGTGPAKLYSGIKRIVFIGVEGDGGGQ